MKKLILFAWLLIPAFSFATTHGDSVAVNYFTIKENPFAQEQVAIIATDSTHTNTLSTVQGHFLFTINGFDDTLKFDKGVAFYDHKITRSSFIYARHTNDNGTHSMLFYIYRGENKLFPIHISWMVLIAIPVILVLLGYMFRRFIIVAVIIFAVFIYFNYHSGLSIGTFFSSIIDGLKSLF